MKKELSESIATLKEPTAIPVESITDEMLKQSENVHNHEFCVCWTEEEEDACGQHIGQHELCFCREPKLAASIEQREQAPPCVSAIKVSAEPPLTLQCGNETGVTCSYGAAKKLL